MYVTILILVLLFSMGACQFIARDRKSKKAAKRDQRFYEKLLYNIDCYDGTSNNQRKVD